MPCSCREATEFSRPERLYLRAHGNQRREHLPGDVYREDRGGSAAVHRLHHLADPRWTVAIGATVTAVLNNDTVVATTTAVATWAAPFTTMRVTAEPRRSRRTRSR